MSNLQEFRDLNEEMKLIKENINSLADDIWKKVPFNNQKKLDKAIAFFNSLNSLLGKYNNNCIELENIMNQYFDIDINFEPTYILPNSTENTNNKRLLSNYNSYTIDSDFGFNHPFAFLFQDTAYCGFSSWVDLYIQFINCLCFADSERLQSLIDDNETPNYENKFFSNYLVELEKPIKIMDNFYVESSITPIQIKEQIIRLIDLYNLSKDSILFFLK